MNTQRFATNKKGEAADINGELYHHGIKVQKWGVTRTPEELGHEQKKRRWFVVLLRPFMSAKP